MELEGTVDLEQFQPFIEKYSSKERDSLLPMLHDAQKIYGWLPREVQQAIGQTLRVPLAEIHGVIEFYSMFYNHPTARRVIRICEDPACYLSGGDEIAKAFQEKLELLPGETNSELTLSYEQVPCLGLCDHGPAALVDGRLTGEIKHDVIGDLVSGNIPETQEKVFGTHRIITEGIGSLNPLRFQDYADSGGFEVLRGSLSKDPEEIIDIIEECGILGRGGAMFPLGRKWRFTRAARGQEIDKYIVVNGDESEPGTFKDRYLMEGDPFAIVEAATIAGYAVGASKGWIFVRGEYPQSYRRLKNAVEESRKSGFLGRNILGSGFGFEIELRLGAGAYICGEETALFSAIEGFRGFPKVKPPFPVTHGLFDKPTAVNNVETLVTALKVLKIGKTEWQKHGTEQSPGTKLFCVSGNINKPGLYEHPFGVTVQQVIDMAGGVKGGRTTKAVLLGGAAGSFIGPADFDLSLTYEDTRSRNLSLGSGVVMVFNETVDLRKIFFQLGRFFAHESCGKCFPCQLGTKRQLEILESIGNGKVSNQTYKRDLIDIGFAMTQTSLCGLGQTAASAMLSAIRLWPELFE
ncbi:MAG: NAD(P)H-dependent oxidoreductase subunit E [Anaerolineae bacterium]|nr:MAG: NAD(P)H-dependent oxidoreductase subunit E [Anaerolineae bacterium]